jgi:predicted nucleic acid-binding protein
VKHLGSLGDRPVRGNTDSRAPKVWVFSDCTEYLSFWRAVCAREHSELKERKAREILDLFSNHVTEGFYRRISLSTEHFIKARRLVASVDSSLCRLDALHLAAALEEGLTLVTADREFARAGKRHKANTLLIKLEQFR